MSLQPSTLRLFSIINSAARARIRIAAELKKIPIINHTIDYPTTTGRTEPEVARYRRDNPNPLIPGLSVTYANQESFTITQSLPILEYFEEVYSGDVRLLPPVTNIYARSKVRELATTAAHDSPPRRDELPPDRELSTTITRHIASRLSTYEKIASRSVGTYSVGDELSLADVCLFAMVTDATQRNVGLERWKVIRNIMRRLEILPAFREAATRESSLRRLKFEGRRTKRLGESTAF